MISSTPFDAGRDSAATAGNALDYQPGVADEDLEAFGAGALAAEQLPTTGHDLQPQESDYTYPTPRPGARLGL
jgi:hypothetical protein